MTTHPNQRQRSLLAVELRRTPVPEAVRSWVARQTVAAIVRIRRLPGASSTAVHVLHLSDGTRLVLRRYVWPGFLEDEPAAPVREVAALRFAFSHGLAVPEVIGADVRGDEVGDGVPTLLMSLLPGRAAGVPDLYRLAKVAASIHDVASEGFSHGYFPWHRDTTHAPPAAARKPELWEKAIETWLERHAHLPAALRAP
jgi:Phosphotransferase enzyme family